MRGRVDTGTSSAVCGDLTRVCHWIRFGEDHGDDVIPDQISLKISDCGLRWVCIYYSKLSNGIYTQVTPVLDRYVMILIRIVFWTVLHILLGRVSMQYTYFYFASALAKLRSFSLACSCLRLSVVRSSWANTSRGRECSFFSPCFNNMSLSEIDMRNSSWPSASPYRAAFNAGVNTMRRIPGMLFGCLVWFVWLW